MEIGPSPTPQAVPRDQKAWSLSRELEAVFLAEMLRQTPLGEGRKALGGGHGEAQFNGMLTMEYARSLAETGQIGLAESIYRSLVSNGSEE